MNAGSRFARWPHGDPRVLAREILANPRFHGVTTAHKPAPNPLERAFAWIGDRLNAVVHAIAHVLGAANGAGALVGFLVLAAGVLLLAYLVFRGVDALIRGRSARRSRTAAAVTRANDDATSAQLWEGALQAALRGRYRAAAALAFLSAIRALDEDGRIAYDPARTPGEYRRLVRDPAFEALARDAVRALFGQAEPSAELFDRMRTNYRSFFEAVSA